MLLLSITAILHDNSTGKAQRGPGVIEAASQLIAAGHSVDLGLMQINSRNLGLLGLGLPNRTSWRLRASVHGYASPRGARINIDLVDS
jgi:hypothetical protein